MMKVLLVEDSSFLTEIIKRVLTDLGCLVDQAQTIADADDLLAETTYECIIIDLHISPIGLKSSEINKYFPIFGWVWIQNILKGLPPKEQKQLKQKIIIHSKYIENLKAECKKSKTDYKEYIIIEKKMTNNETNIENLKKEVAKMIKKTQNNENHS